MASDFGVSEALRRIEHLIRVGTVEEFDGGKAAVRVRWGPDDDSVSDWLPIVQLGSKDVTIWAPPVVGSQVTVLSEGGDTARGLVMPGPYAGNAPDDRGEAVRLTMPGLDLEIAGGVATVTVSTAKFVGNVEVDGDLKVTGSTDLTSTKINGIEQAGN
ncbi:phage baseplate assembly protein V [uncultured Nocardioides sp.]|uniref:phage baseplate assembly protein V n=1 Tax=uncultured Nocardioides sp. TaxID=198441 RepID=UPI0026056E88|nr:phage baseplate assembly protein V [uncultured Nocardioides sp.]